METKITAFTHKLGDAVENLQRRYIAANPKGTKFIPAEMYYQMPAFEQGRNVFCALAQSQLVGYSALLPQPAHSGGPPGLTHMIWVHIRVDPGNDDIEKIRNLLYERIYEKSLYYARTWQGRLTRIAISYPNVRGEEIAFFASKGFLPFNSLLQMHRDLFLAIPDLKIPKEITIQRWDMKTYQDKRKYVAAAAVAFPQAPPKIEDIEFYMRSWKGGIPIIALNEKNEIVGGLMAFWYDSRRGVTEDIFVLPSWQRKGIARHLIAEGIRYLVEQEIEIAGLEVKESNIPAVHLYQSMGYEITNREDQWAKII